MAPPKTIPVTPIFMDLPTVAQAVAMSTATIERLEREGQFPKRRQLSGQRVGWLVREVQEWAESRPVSNLPRRRIPGRRSGRRRRDGRRRSS